MKKPRIAYAPWLSLLLAGLLMLGICAGLAEDTPEITVAVPSLTDAETTLEANASAADEAATDVVSPDDAATDDAAADEAALADALAGQIYAEAAQEEISVTPLLQSLEADSIHLIGLEHRLKTPESISRKLLLNAHDMEISLEEAVEVFYDALLYTFIIDEDQYITGTDAILKALTEHDYKVEYFRNTWGSDGYKGINTNLSTPDGYLFEIQFHTQESFETKEYKTHALYEIARSETSTEEEKREANAKQKELFAAVSIPEDAASYDWKDQSKPE